MAFNYENEEKEFFEDFGFRKDWDVEESISKFSSHVPYNPEIPTKSELLRTDSNVISEENLDWSSNNVSILRETERIVYSEEEEEAKFQDDGKISSLYYLKLGHFHNF